MVAQVVTGHGPKHPELGGVGEAGQPLLEGGQGLGILPGAAIRAAETQPGAAQGNLAQSQRYGLLVEGNGLGLAPERVVQAGHLIMQLGVLRVLDELQQTVLASLFNPSLGPEGFQLFHMRSCMGMSFQYACESAAGKWGREGHASAALAEISSRRAPMATVRPAGDGASQGVSRGESRWAAR
ncbi:hypothetical protein D3C72_1571260 [compost metagenome]